MAIIAGSPRQPLFDRQGIRAMLQPDGNQEDPVQPPFEETKKKKKP
jgi:hypothetical protein